MSAFVTVDERARQSRGISADPIYRAVAELISRHHSGRGQLLDVGCGTGLLWGYVQEYVDSYQGADVVRHKDFPEQLPFLQVDLDSHGVPCPDGEADIVVAVETIEHLENPRAFFRELLRLTRPGGHVLVTTPNQLSLLSKWTLIVKNQFNAFQDSCYPAHITALLEIDLRRMATECGLTELKVSYTCKGRIPLTPWNYPRFLSRFWPRALSDNILILGTKPPS